MKQIKELRAKNKISQQELANKLHVARSTVAMWETGGSQPDNNDLVSLSKIFNVSIDYLLGNSENKKETAPTEQPLYEIPDELFSLITDLSDEDKSKVISFVRFLKSEQNQ